MERERLEREREKGANERGYNYTRGFLKMFATKMPHGMPHQH